jgi:hypothetical protein
MSWTCLKRLFRISKRKRVPALSLEPPKPMDTRSDEVSDKKGTDGDEPATAGLVGVENDGTSCFLAVVLQWMLGLPAVVEFLTSLL